MTASCVAGVLVLAGCQFKGVTSLPLPGGVSTGPNAYTVTAEFADVTNLVPHAAVKVNDVTVGEVSSIELKGWHAKVTCVLENSVELPDNAVAKVSQESLLGAKFVRLAPPSTANPRGELSDGDDIPLTRTGRYPEVEEVLSALSLLLNGGGLKQLHTITTELNAVMDGREQRLNDLLDQLDTFVSGLEEQKSEIVRALNGVKRLSGTLRKQKQTIAEAVDHIEPALEVLNDQQDELTKMLVALSDLGDVATDVINKTREDLLANLHKLKPILAKLADAGAGLPNALELIATFPFPKTTKKGIAGDYVNLKATADTNVDTVLHNLLSDTSFAGQLPASQSQGNAKQGAASGGSASSRQPPGSTSARQAPSSPTPSLPGNAGESNGPGVQAPESTGPDRGGPERGGTDRGNGGGTGSGDGPGSGGGTGSGESGNSDGLLDLLLGRG